MTRNPNAPLVSIIIPTFNRAAWLARAIASALAQSHERIEVLVMDDCSSDDTETTVRAIRDPRVKYHRHSERVGMVRNHGSGFERASGTYVAVLSDDDAWRENYVGNRVATFARHPGAAVVFSGYERCNERFEITGRMEPRLPADVPLDPRQLLKAAIRRKFTIASCLYRRDALMEMWPDVEKCGGAFDTGLQLQFVIRHPTGGIYMPWCDVIYTLHPGQTSISDKAFDQGCVMYTETLRTPMPPWVARRIKHNFAVWHVNRGRALAKQGDLAKARNSFRDAISAYPFTRAAWTDYATSFIAPGKLKKPW